MVTVVTYTRGILVLQVSQVNVKIIEIYQDSIVLGMYTSLIGHYYYHAFALGIDSSHNQVTTESYRVDSSHNRVTTGVTRVTESQPRVTTTAPSRNRVTTGSQPSQYLGRRCGTSSTTYLLHKSDVSLCLVLHFESEIIASIKIHRLLLQPGFLYFCLKVVQRR